MAKKSGKGKGERWMPKYQVNNSWSDNKHKRRAPYSYGCCLMVVHRNTFLLSDTIPYHDIEDSVGTTVQPCAGKRRKGFALQI